MSGTKHVSPTGELESSLKGLGPPKQVMDSASPGIRRRTMSSSVNKPRSRSGSTTKKPVNEKTFSHLKRMVHDGGASSDVALSSDGGTPSRASPIGHRRKLKKGNLTKSLGWLSKFNNVIECFGKDISSAQKAVWLGSALITGTPSENSAWDTVREMLKKDLTESQKVFVVLSPICIGVVDAKPKKGENPRVLQRDSPENVTLVISEQDSTDGLLIAVVTENQLLRYNSIHVFGMKRVADGQELADCIRNVCGLEQDASGRRMSKLSSLPRRSVLGDGVLSPEGAPVVTDGSERIFTVQYLGSANVSSEAWWKRVAATVPFEANVLYSQAKLQKKTFHQLNSVRDVFCEPFRNPEAEVHHHFATEVVFSVTANKLSIYSCNTQELIASTMTQAITLIKKVALPDDVIQLVEPELAGAVDDDDKTGTDAGDAGRLLTDEQRVLVMEKVKAGDITIDEAIAVVLRAETEIRKAERGQIVNITYRDHELDSIHIIALLSKGGRALDTILEAVAKSRKNANLKVSDPFEPLKAGASCPQTSSVLQNAELDRNTLTAVEHVGNGEFGEVYLANQVVDRTELNGQLVEVEARRAVKTLKPKLPEHCARTFTSEARVHLDFKHENIVKCLGVCMAQQPFLVVLEYCMYGDLKKVLTACKDRELEVRGTEFVSFGRQIADAFAYLTAMRIVHMDLATRNVLVGKGGMLKVADFGLAQTYNKGSDGWKLAGKLRLPFLWVPPECLPEKLWNPKMVEYEPIFNEQTDMWSYGVLLWEMFTYGGSPYSFTEKLLPVLVKVFHGLRLEVPNNAPAICGDIMMQCFAKRAERPTFTTVERQLRDAMEASAEVVRDFGQLLNAPLEQQIEKMSKDVSMQRQASVAVLRQRTVEGVADKIPTMTVVDEASRPSSVAGSRVVSTRDDSEDEEGEEIVANEAENGADTKEGTPPGTPPPTKVVRRPSQCFFDVAQWELSEMGQLVRSPNPSRQSSRDHLKDIPPPASDLTLYEDDAGAIAEDAAPAAIAPTDTDVLKTFSVARTRRRLSSSKLEEDATAENDTSDDESGALSPLAETPIATPSVTVTDSPSVTQKTTVAPADNAVAEDVGYVELGGLSTDDQNPFGDNSDESEDDIDVDVALESLSV